MWTEAEMRCKGSGGVAGVVPEKPLGAKPHRRLRRNGDRLARLKLPLHEEKISFSLQHLALLHRGDPVVIKQEPAPVPVACIAEVVPATQSAHVRDNSGDLVLRVLVLAQSLRVAIGPHIEAQALIELDVIFCLRWIVKKELPSLLDQKEPCLNRFTCSTKTSGKWESKRRRSAVVVSLQYVQVTASASDKVSTSTNLVKRSVSVTVWSVALAVSRGELWRTKHKALGESLEGGGETK
jgi:hypothetical protein